MASDAISRAEKAAARRYAQPVLSLEGRAVSPEAKALVAYCLDELVLPFLPQQQKRPSTLPAIRWAAEGLLAGLIAQTQGDGWTRRPLSSPSFTREPGISLRQFLKVMRPLVDAGLVDAIGGYSYNQGPVVSSAETRLRLSEEGRRLVVSYGVDGDGHFAPIGS